MKRLLGVVIIELIVDVDVIYKVFEAKNIDNNIDILNDYADPLYEPILLENEKGIVRQLEHEPNPKFWNFITTERCFYRFKNQLIEEIRGKCNNIFNSTEEL